MLKGFRNAIINEKLEIVCPYCKTELAYLSGKGYTPDYLYCPKCKDVAYDFDGYPLFRLALDV